MWRNAGLDCSRPQVAFQATLCSAEKFQSRLWATKMAFMFCGSHFDSSDSKVTVMFVIFQTFLFSAEKHPRKDNEISHWMKWDVNWKEETERGNSGFLGINKINQWVMLFQISQFPKSHTTSAQEVVRWICLTEGSRDHDMSARDRLQSTKTLKKFKRERVQKQEVEDSFCYIITRRVETSGKEPKLHLTTDSEWPGDNSWWHRDNQLDSVL